MFQRGAFGPCFDYSDATCSKYARGDPTHCIEYQCKNSPGDQGCKGDKGDKGEYGPQGVDGNPGPQGDRGMVGDTGNNGTDGEKGCKGDKVTLVNTKLHIFIFTKNY